MSDNIVAARYLLQEQLGAGGMGVVYRALDTLNGETVAIKQIKHGAADPDQVARFKREGDVLRELNHPNIIKLLDTFEYDGQHHLVMRYISGGNLSQRMTQQPFTLEQIIHVGIDLADALTQAHKRNVIHRDLKPANILIDADNTVLLTDFGLAHMADSAGITSTGAIVGTIDYLPPEAFKEGPRDASGDIWSFGVILAEMLIGTNPFTRPTLLETIWAITSEPTPDLESAAPVEAVSLVDLIYRMLERDPAARIVSARHVGAALEDIAHDSSRRIHTSARFNTPTSQLRWNVRNNLPQQITPLIGRDRELSDVSALLRGQRLVTIVAPGGMGKTHLALEVGRRLLDSFSDGVYFVDLAPISSADAIVPSIAEALGFHFQQDGREPHQQMLDFLRSKALLLILDNFEHVADASPLVNELLQTAPNVRTLVTSRQRLNLTGETAFTLDYLDVPADQSADAVDTFSAIRLFLQSAHRVRPDFTITPENVSAVTRICRMVEGLPLGIVLATSWLSMLSPDEIADELQSSLHILDADLGDLPERQRSMRAVFDYSWELLSSDEKAALTRLSVFRGGFARDAAQTVTGTRLHTLMTLLNKSLLRRDVASGRFSIHEVIRQLAEEQRTTSAHDALTRDGHRDYYLNLLAALTKPLRTDGQIKALADIETDFENMRLAWRHASNTAALAQLGAAAEALFHFARMRNRHSDVRALFELALRHDFTPTTAAERLGYVRLLLWSTVAETGTIATPDLDRMARRLTRVETLLDAPDLAEQASYERWFLQYQILRRDLARGVDSTMKVQFDQLTEQAEEQGDRWLLALAHHSRGYMDLMLNRYDQPLEATKQSYEIFKALGNLSWTAVLANNLAVLLMSACKYDEAEPYLDECVNVYRALGDEARAAHSLCVRGNMNFARGSIDRATRDFNEAAPITRELGYPMGLSLAYNGLGFMALIAGNRDEARRFLQESMAAIPHITYAPDRMIQTVVLITTRILMDDIPDPSASLREIAPSVRRLPSNPYGWFFVIAVIHVLTVQGEYQRAAEVAGTLHTRVALSEGFRHLIAPTLEQVRAAIGPEAYDTAWRAGEASMDFPALLQILLNEFDPT